MFSDMEVKSGVCDQHCRPMGMRAPQVSRGREDRLKSLQIVHFVFQRVRLNIQGRLRHHNTKDTECEWLTARKSANGIQERAAICHLARKTTDAHLWKWRTSASDQPAKLSRSFGVGVMWNVRRCVSAAVLLCFRPCGFALMSSLLKLCRFSAQ